MKKKTNAKKITKTTKRGKTKQVNREGTTKGPEPRSIDWEVCARLVEKQASQAECASICGVARQTLSKRMESELGLDWGQFFELHSGRGVFALRKKIYDMAMEGNVTLLKHLGETICGQNPRLNLSLTGANGGDVRFRNVSDDDLEEKLKGLLKNITVLKDA